MTGPVAAQAQKDRFAVVRGRHPGIEAVLADSARQFSRHTHDRFGVGLVMRGGQRSASGRGEVEAGPGDIITVNPGEVHDGLPVGGEGRAWRMLYLDPDLVLEGLADIGGGRQAYEFTSPALTDRRVAQNFAGLFAAVLGPAESDTGLVVGERLLAVLGGLMGVAVPREHGVAQGLLRARARIDDDPAAWVDLALLAREAGLSRFQTVRGFKKLTGLTPHAYVMQARLNLARRLLAEGTPPAAAASAAGFFDQSHLTRLFARTVGLTPGAYARAAV